MTTRYSYRFTVHQKSVIGWLVGAGLGAVAGYFAVRNKNSMIKKPLFGAALGALGGSMFVGAVNDARLERNDPDYCG